MLRLRDNPAARFPGSRSLSDDLGSWAVAQVRPRQEKSLASSLAGVGIPYYLPLVERKTRRRDNGKPRKSLIPLFPGYVAVAPTEDDRKLVYGTNRLVRLLPVKDQAGFVHELSQVQRALDSGFQIAVAPSVSVGQLARVRSGPLMGLEGEVVGTNGQTRFVMWVQMFQQAVQVEVDELDLEPV